MITGSWWMSNIDFWVLKWCSSCNPREHRTSLCAYNPHHTWEVFLVNLTPTKHRSVLWWNLLVCNPKWKAKTTRLQVLERRENIASQPCCSPDGLFQVRANTLRSLLGGGSCSAPMTASPATVPIPGSLGRCYGGRGPHWIETGNSCGFSQLIILKQDNRCHDFESDMQTIECGKNQALCSRVAKANMPAVKWFDIMIYFLLLDYLSNFVHDSNTFMWNTVYNSNNLNETLGFSNLN